jgi:hypothetical protein
MKNRESIFDVFSVKQTVNNPQLTELINFLMDNRDVRLDHDITKQITSRDPLIKPGISHIFRRAVMSGKDNIFSFCNIPMNTNAPEIVTYDYVSFDFAQLAGKHANLYKDTTFIPGFKDTVFYNVSSVIKTNNEPSDINQFQAKCVLSMLSRSYYNSGVLPWLTPTIIRFLCRSYNMSIGTAISSSYGLTYAEMQIIKTILSFYFLKCVASVHEAEVLIKTSKLDLGPTNEIQDVVNKIKELLGDKYENISFDDMCYCIQNCGIGRLSGVNRKWMVQRLKSLGPDMFTTSIALEYPPYFCYLLLLAEAGKKIGMFNILMKTDLKREVNEFIDNIIKSPSFISTI